MTDQLADARAYFAAERARDELARAAYEAECLASWGSNPPANVVLTERFPQVSA